MKELVNGNYSKALDTGSPILRFLFNIGASGYSVYEYVHLQSNAPYHDEMIKNNDFGKYDTYVIVIGESARKDLMSMYGFNMETTPYADKMNGIIFNNYLSASGATQLSLINTLSRYPNIGDNIITIANDLGMSTYWISNQGFSGENNGPVASIALRAKEYTFFSKKDYSPDHYSSDEKVIPVFKKVLLEKSNKKLIVVHLMGSHSPFCLRVNDQSEFNFIDKNMSCYLQSIKNTDSLIKRMIEIMISDRNKWSLMYFSDHGLSHSDSSSIGHNDKYKENFEVPFFITSYNDDKRIHINNNRSALSFLNIFSEWLGISFGIDNCKFLEEGSCGPENKVINFKRNMINVDSLPRDNFINK